ncbi:MAG: Uncharacterised protein [Flavobacterium sp. SCGC AAA160-P02]|nr:MAG: Uncharacterised protein [Flavobacterium sp. SCGC AAA160-P02]
MRPHFWYTTNQRNGILFLLAIIFIIQLLYHFLNFGNQEILAFNQDKINSLQHQIDSLHQHDLAIKKFKIYPFNPNYISDFKGYQLGMNTKQIDRLLAFRNKRLFVNSAKEFQQVTKISDSLLNSMSPYFKFPEWIQKKKKRRYDKNFSYHTIKHNISDISTNDINKANKNDFLSITGVDDDLSDRIIKYRSKLQGFSIPEQLFEVWGIHREVGSQILEVFSIIEKPVIDKINLNTASFKEVLSNPYINYELCVKIFDYRDEVAELQSISELKNIKGFPNKKYNRIVLYLHAQ